MINYIFLSYLLFPFAFSLGVYLQERHRVNSRGEKISLLRWIIFVLGDFYRNPKLFFLFIISPVMLPIEICFTLKDLFFPSPK